ncbi:SDR family oxidoreductase [Propionimicrobium sp. PCR01-08-3]|uniref:SDR family oxidoreductase n=1 Tax=Propionimicrobium sp. PCR01-08-3 TaxID=3052086 RepID=UPI00255CD29B|nr:SDR family oxidoreductase [Propionimicrobium sp. PCR01-08-3]WIY82285.1 SDR family oxidoreductase [Propionimicrobium sp. PCR01-08-3]
MTTSTDDRKIAVVTGASSGIGAASARALAGEGFTVFCAARRIDRLTELADEIGGVAIACDVTDQAQVDALAEAVGPRCDVLLNNAGGAFGQDPIETADVADWEQMYQINVAGSLRVTQALLGAIEQAHGAVIFITSTAAETAYEGGAGYCGAKSAERSMAGSLRLELAGRPVRVCEISPGMVRTDEFSLVRFEGDQAKADAVYAGVDQPLVAEDIAECVRWIATLSEYVNIDRLVIRPRAQASNWKVARS